MAVAVAIVACAPAPASVARGAGPSRHPGARAALIHPAPAVQLMVVGAGNLILAPARAISVPATTITTSRGSCGVAAATPLAALADLHRLGGPRFAVRDYGHCTSGPANSGQLFVYSLDGETNHAQNGWEYKVNSRSGTAGAGDPGGPFGNGRVLAAGSKVLWFWCQAFGGGCQRTLELSLPSRVARRSAFTVTVTGYDNDGHGQPMSGARVSLQGSAGVTDGSGRATLRAPARAGTFAVRASRPGSVPAFPGVVLVR